VLVGPGATVHCLLATAADSAAIVAIVKRAATPLLTDELQELFLGRQLLDARFQQPRDRRRLGSLVEAAGGHHLEIGVQRFANRAKELIPRV